MHCFSLFTPKLLSQYPFLTARYKKILLCGVPVDSIQTKPEFKMFTHLPLNFLKMSWSEAKKGTFIFLTTHSHRLNRKYYCHIISMHDELLFLFEFLVVIQQLMFVLFQPSKTTLPSNWLQPELIV